jgi:Fe-S-cluster-containing hydrogenase component 2
MKTLAVKKDVRCMACLACEIACSEAFYKEFSPALSCVRIADKNGEGQPRVCVQCGKCAKACPNEAITKNTAGVYMLDKKKCTGCGACVDSCPFGVMVKSEKREQPSKCIACGICVKKCPMELLYIKEA